MHVERQDLNRKYYPNDLKVDKSVSIYIYIIYRIL